MQRGRIMQYRAYIVHAGHVYSRIESSITQSTLQQLLGHQGMGLHVSYIYPFERLTHGAVQATSSWALSMAGVRWYNR